MKQKETANERMNLDRLLVKFNVLNDAKGWRKYVDIISLINGME